MSGPAPARCARSAAAAGFAACSALPAPTSRSSERMGTRHRCIEDRSRRPPGNRQRARTPRTRRWPRQRPAARERPRRVGSCGLRRAADQIGCQATAGMSTLNASGWCIRAPIARPSTVGLVVGATIECRDPTRCTARNACQRWPRHGGGCHVSQDPRPDRRRVGEGGSTRSRGRGSRSHRGLVRNALSGCLGRRTREHVPAQRRERSNRSGFEEPNATEVGDASTYRGAEASAWRRASSASLERVDWMTSPRN